MLEQTVSVVGVGQVGPVMCDARSIPEMVLECVEAALCDASIGYGAVAAVVTASVDLFDGLTASNIAVTEVTGAVMRPETRIAADSLCAFIHGACLVGCGAHDTVLIVAHGKASMAPRSELECWAMDPITVQSLGVDFDACAALQARLLATDGAEQRWAALASRRQQSAGETPFGKPQSPESILGSPVLASPLRSAMRAPSGDGVSAVILKAAGGNSDEIVISGMGHDLDCHALGDRELSSLPGLRRACERAYAGAGIHRPEVDIELAEPSCLFPHEEELFLRESGLGSAVAVSPGGGLFAGTAPFVAGLSRVTAAVLELRQTRFHRALVHGQWGPAGQGQAVAVLETRGGGK